MKEVSFVPDEDVGKVFFLQEEHAVSLVSMDVG